jgi:predicted dithiol-disulfide oxidoreductase (DUF899 family)
VALRANGFLAKEKEFTRLRDELSRERRELPWEVVDKKYVFEGSNGKQSLPELFEGRNQLIVYHFMFDPSWEEGCKSWGELMHRLKGYAEGKKPWSSLDGIVQITYRSRDARIGSNSVLNFQSLK